VDSLLENAQKILETAESAARNGESCTSLTILMGLEGGMRVIAQSDWPLDSLALHYGARAVFRVSERYGCIRVEAREGARSCILESSPAPPLHLLPGSGHWPPATDHYITVR